MDKWAVLGATMRERLARAGFRTIAEVRDLSPSQLAAELQCPVEEASGVLQTLLAVDRAVAAPPPTTTALSLLQREQEQPHISTGCRELDDVCGGRGVPLGRVTEFCGAPGIGKTQLGIQLAVNAQLPVQQGGASGHAIYIDTEGSFVVERALEIAAAAVGSASTDATDALLAGIMLYRVHDHVEEIALAHLLDEIIEHHPQVKLVVLDSVAFHFRYDFTDLALRTRLLNTLAQLLTRVASKCNVAVVLLNQMTTRIRSDAGGREQSQLVPALGDSWAHASNVRIQLYWQGGTRYAQVLKSPHAARAMVPYQITCDGVRSVDAAASSGSLKRTRVDDFGTV